VAKSKTGMPGRLGSTFWKLLGASTEKNQARSLSEVKGSADYEDKARDLSDEKLLKAAGDAAADEAEIIADVRGSAAYKRELLRVYIGRALRAARGDRP